MFQPESGHGIMWAHNNADATVGFILILILKMDLTESRHWSKCKACLSRLTRQFFFLSTENHHWFPELMLWHLGSGSVTNYCTMWQTSFWTTALAHVVTFVWCSVFYERTSILFQAMFVLTRQHDLSTTADIPTPLFGFTHSVSSPSLAFPSVLNSLTGNVLLYLTLNSHHRHRQIVHLSFFYFTLKAPENYYYLHFHVSQTFREHMMSSENYAANKVKAAWRWSTQQAAQRDLLTLTTESWLPLRCILKGSGWSGSRFGALCKATAL